MNLAFNIDCIKAMRQMPDEYIDLTVTSPPYDDLREYNGYENSFDYRQTLKELFRISKPGAVVVWIVYDRTEKGSETGSSFRQALYAKDCGFRLHDTMIWLKDGASHPDSMRYYDVFNYMFIFSKGKPKTVHLIADRVNKTAGRKITGSLRYADGTTKPKSGIRYGRITQPTGVRYNVWEQPCEKYNRTGHPAVFPYRLVRDHILSWSDENDLVLDPFLGSGTTRLAAYDLNRQFIGFEIDKTYFDAEEKRFTQYQNERDLHV